MALSSIFGMRLILTLCSALACVSSIFVAFMRTFKTVSKVQSGSLIWISKVWQNTLPLSAEERSSWLESAIRINHPCSESSWMLLPLPARRGRWLRRVESQSQTCVFIGQTAWGHIVVNCALRSISSIFAKITYIIVSAPRGDVKWPMKTRGWNLSWASGGLDHTAPKAACGFQLSALWAN